MVFHADRNRTYRGLRFGLVLRPQFPTEVYLEGRALREDTLSRDHQGARAVLNALERLTGGYALACHGIRQDLAVAEGQLRDYQARLGKPFTHESYLAELTSLRDQLKAGLFSGSAQKEGKDEGPSISELAGRIKAIKAAHTVEATPERVRQKHIGAEEPITARIRRRTESNASDSAMPGSLAPKSMAQVSTAARSAGLALRFEERIASGRRKREDGRRPSE
jgi:hypothetical protein